MAGHRAANGWWRPFPWPLEDTTFIAALRHDRITAPCVFDGPINGASFLAWVQQALVPTLSAGDIVIMDNLSSHKVAGVHEAIEAVGATPLYLPPLQPRSQSHRTGLRQAQSHSPQGRRQNRR